jgi:hypothetical protein
MNVLFVKSPNPVTQQAALFPCLWASGGNLSHIHGHERISEPTAGRNVFWLGFQSHPPCPAFPDHGRRPLARAPSTGTNACLKRLESTNDPFCLYFALCTKLYICRWSTLLRVYVLPDGDVRTGFHAPTELGPRFLRPLKVFPCIRKSSRPECMRLIRISPALRILS